ncbi:MAG: DUF4405 domain-containing protein [Nanoarchaeota archaeon]|nr:DUF4405 domain-containing protein [Nanoarchaeota archaeon]
MCDKNTWKYIVDIGLLISGLGVIVTGIVKFRTLWHLLSININYEAMNMGVYRIVHDWSGLAMTIFVIIHLVLNWDWIKGTTRSFFKKEEIKVSRKKK